MHTEGVTNAMTVHVHVWSVVLALLGFSVTATAASFPMPSGNGLGVGVWAVQGDAPAVRLFLRNGKNLGGSPVEPSAYAYAPIMLGEVRIPGATRHAWALTGADWAHQVYRLSGVHAQDGVRALGITVSRLSPAVLLDLHGACACALFAGEKAARWSRWKYGGLARRNEFVSIPPYKMPNWVRPEIGPELKKALREDCPPRAPRHYAWSDGAAVRVGRFSEAETTLAGAERGWLLVWHRADNRFLTGASSQEMLVRVGYTYRPAAGDAPMLIIPSQPPTVRLTGDKGAGPEGGLTLTFPQPGAKLALLPLFGYQLPLAAETEAWSRDGHLPSGISRRCDWWAAHLAEYPLTVTETLAYDADADAAMLGETFTFTRVRPGGTRGAPVAPMLELARRAGFPIALDGTINDAGLSTYCGPYAVIDGADGYTARITGMGKYVRDTPLAPPPLVAPDTPAAWTQDELAAEVDKVLAAGHLAPYHLSYKTAWGWGAYMHALSRPLYSAPGQALSTLRRVLPYLDAARRQRVIAYLTEERRAFPPERLAALPYGVGARREARAKPEAIVKDEAAKYASKQNFHTRTKTIPVQALYDLAGYYGVKVPSLAKDEGFDLVKAISQSVLPWMERTEWATLGWYAWNHDASGGWPWPASQRDPEPWGSYGWSLTVDINRQLAGLIGCARLARMTGDAACEQRAMAHLARAMAHRFAVGKYVAWLYGVGGILLPPPDGFGPVDDPRTIALSEEEAVLEYGIYPFGFLPSYSDEEGPYSAIVPETARFFADYLKPEAAAFARMQATWYPDAWLTLGTPRRIAEWWHNYPQDSHQLFLVHAWILGADGDFLQEHLDVPLVPVGDWYYLDKLVATLQAYAGVQKPATGRQQAKKREAR